MSKPLLVIKFGTSSISKEDGFPDEPVLVEIARQIARLHDHYRIVLVSSGAVGTGKAYLKNFSGKIKERKAAAAIGNPILLKKYAGFFAPYGIHIAQSLCERHHFSNRNQFLQLKQTFELLWENNIIPVANENDVVSNLELKFSDNDELACLIAIGFGASLLLLGTSVPGVLDENGKLLREIKTFDKQVMSLAKKESSTGGLGGMISKLTFARLASSMGIKVVIFGSRTENAIAAAIAGETGTVCHPKEVAKSARQKWLASGSVVSGSLLIDQGAAKALENRKSLLSVGVVKVEGLFDAGEVIEILDENGRIAVARSRYSSKEVEANLNQQNCEIANADDIVLL